MRRREFLGGLSCSVAAWPVMARAQQPASVIGLLSVAKIPDWAVGAFKKGLDQVGYTEGRNLTFVARSAEGQLDQLPTMAADLVNNRVSVIFATGGPIPTRAAKVATTEIPIVFAYGGDPVADGLVESINRPGGNVTGATFIGSSLAAKRLDLLRTVVPGAIDVAILVNPKGTLAESQVKDAKVAAQTLGLRLHVINASSEAEINDAFQAMESAKIGALLVGIDPLFGFVLSPAITNLASRYKIPTTYDSRAFIDVGGLMSYGPNLPDTFRQAGLYAGRILKGEKPSELPVIQPTNFELVINLKAAKTLGVEIPPPLLFTADEVID
jgi:putative tryptophan/tyrosine transport system substrate-binding protein